MILKVLKSDFGSIIFHIGKDNKRVSRTVIECEMLPRQIFILDFRAFQDVSIEHDIPSKDAPVIHIHVTRRSTRVGIKFVVT